MSNLLAVGQPVTFTRIDTGGKVGEIRFTAVKALPAECIASSRPGVTLAIEVAISNGPGEQLPVPDSYQMLYDDDGETSSPVETASIYGCESDFPQVKTAPPGQQTHGWFAVRTKVAPSQLIYTPMVGDQTSTAGNIKILAVAPAMVMLSLPAQLTAETASASPSAPAAASSAPVVAPTTTTAAGHAMPVAPPTGLDSEGRPNGSGGRLVGCADELTYQPGTGVYEDGSRGFAAECLPGGSLR
ncbi:hypothetical protein ACFXPS_44340 [Nocardia sp. NPDC059091]|uniref:hypothetical protein n=1 Tax=Nocardia sp. NPDC059091 TaxID=3346724 RepID=UPI0036CB1B75